MSGRLRVFESSEALVQAAADFILEQAAESRGRFAVALSGGDTPEPVYRRLARGAGAGRFPWDRAHWFWGDERFVPPTHPDSNFRMAREAMLAHVPAPASHIHAVPTTDTTAGEAAARYERTLMDFYGAQALEPGRPLFDVNLMGIGADGHTASLFPGQPALEENERWVVSVPHGAPEPRVTLTYPALASSRVVLVLVAGHAKREALARALAGDAGVPAGRLRAAGEHWWYADRAAAGT